MRILKQCGVAQIKDKHMENKLRWCGQIHQTLRCTQKREMPESILVGLED